MNFKYEQRVSLEDINDSMELDSGTTISKLSGELPDGAEFSLTLEVQGHVKVDFKGERYSCASNMPDELIRLFHKGGYSPGHPELEVHENNWFELFLEVNRRIEWSDCVDAEGMNELEVFGLMYESYRELREEHKRAQYQHIKHHDMNKNYIESLIDEMVDRGLISSEEKEKNARIIAHANNPRFTGNWTDDCDLLDGAIRNAGRAEEAEPEDAPDPVEQMEKTIEGLKIGFNYVPGIGFGYCSNEEDLERMKDFVRGGLVMRESMCGSTEEF